MGNLMTISARTGATVAALVAILCGGAAPPPDATPGLELVNRARDQAARDEPDEAIRTCSIALDRFPGLAEAWRERAAIRVRRAEWREAVSDAARAVALAPRDNDARLVSAEAHAGRAV